MHDVPGAPARARGMWPPGWKSPGKDWTESVVQVAVGRPRVLRSHPPAMLSPPLCSRWSLCECSRWLLPCRALCPVRLLGAVLPPQQLQRPLLLPRGVPAGSGGACAPHSQVTARNGWAARRSRLGGLGVQAFLGRASASAPRGRPSPGAGACASHSRGDLHGALCPVQSTR